MEHIIDFYFNLFNFLRRRGSGSQLCYDLKGQLRKTPKDFFMTLKMLDQVLAYHAHPGRRQNIHDLVCDMAFKDLCGFFDNDSAQGVFDSLIRFCQKRDHLYVMFLSPDKEFPNFVQMICNDPKRFKANLLLLRPEWIHIFDET